MLSKYCAILYPMPTAHAFVRQMLVNGCRGRVQTRDTTEPNQGILAEGEGSVQLTSF